jgi:hypothetical protein
MNCIGQNFRFLTHKNDEVSPLLWSSEILGYTIPEGEPGDAEKDLHPGV